ncbi:lamina-associated polypeptide 2, isoforms alpha/zeta-like [Rana temporaria]|uniref:lamina-associated polypeptide 2, isoforms alpha/zeta-like n=1 Tax=Rana temporaria TaxID=8407 RepID=UPI001AAD397E|nr:lamina-associated polypeptide 2, isoforms alpha/zeta-like [Rana temporaria]
MKEFLAVQSQMLSTLKEFKDTLKNRDPEPIAAGPSSQESSSTPVPRVSRARESLLSDTEDSEAPEDGVVDSHSEDEDARSGKYIFSTDDMGGLLSAVYASEGIQQPAELVSPQDRMYQGLAKPQPKVIPVHQSLKDIVLREWAEPEKKLLRYKTWKRRCPFKEELENTLFKTPKLDASLAQLSRQSDLSFEDAGNLKDSLDRRADTSLRRAWEANTAALGPALASSCIARNADTWLTRLLEHVPQTSKFKEIRDSLTVIGSAVAYLADASIETVRSSAKTGALVNAARRAVWLKTWEGDLASKTRLCALPFEGTLLFGAGLDQALTRASEKGKRFPPKPRPNRRRFFRGPQNKNRPSDRRSAFNKRWIAGKDKPKGGILFPDPKPAGKDSK